VTDVPHASEPDDAPADIRLTDAELHRLGSELAHLYQDRNATAQVLNASIGLSASRLPQGIMDPEVLWGDVLFRLRRGIACEAEHPFRALLEWLLRRWPNNPLLGELRRSHLPPPPPPPPTLPPPGKESWFRRWKMLLPTVAGAVAIVVAVVLVGVRVLADDHASCPVLKGTALKGNASSLSCINGEWVGYSDGGFAFGAHDHVVGDNGTIDALTKVQDVIYRENQCAEELSDKHRPRPSPLITLVYLVGLSAPADTGVNWAAAQLADLEGLVTWQVRQNVGSDLMDCAGNGSGRAPDGQSSPAPDGQTALRVIIANGGSKMQSADRVADTQLQHLVTTDKTVVGVLGLDRSVSQTEHAISVLGTGHIPAVATSITGDDLADLSPYYLQIGPSDNREAQLITDFAWQQHRPEVDVYYQYPDVPNATGKIPTATCGDTPPDVSDRGIYALTRDIRDQAARVSETSMTTTTATTSATSASGVTTDSTSTTTTSVTSTRSDANGTTTTANGTGMTARLFGYRPSGCDGMDLTTWLRGQCARQGAGHLIFYAGRVEQYDDFLNGMRDCLDTSSGQGGVNLNTKDALVVADDSVSRWVDQYAGGASPYVLRYVSKAPAAAQAGPACKDGTLTQTNSGVPLRRELPDFCAELAAMYRATKIAPPPITWADERAALAYDGAKIFIDAAVGADTQAGVDVESLWRKIRATPDWGATGELDFSVGQVAEAKAMGIMRIDMTRTATATTGDPAVFGEYVITGNPPITTDGALRPRPPTYAG
jgi:hypothetical protein